MASGAVGAFAQPPHLRYPGIAVWFTAPAGAVVQVVEPVRGTLDMASWLVGPVYRDIERHFPGNYSLILVFDLALLTGRSAAARSVFLAKARECGRRFEAGYFTQPLAASAAYRQATRASLELVRALGVKVELVSSAAEAVRILRLRALSLGVESEAPATDAH